MNQDSSLNRPNSTGVLGIVKTNAKTELCRNWPNCFYGETCAFAHGEEELRVQSLTEMQKTGRIPKAEKFRCYPCHNWIATGACPYAARCIFIHDPRIQGSNAAWLQQPKSTTTSRQAHAYQRDFFFWPDLKHDACAVPSVDMEYNFEDKTKLPVTDHPSFSLSAASRIWSSFLDHLDESSVFAQHSTNSFQPTVTSTTSLSNYTDLAIAERRLSVFENLATRLDSKNEENIIQDVPYSTELNALSSTCFEGECLDSFDIKCSVSKFERCKYKVCDHGNFRPPTYESLVISKFPTMISRLHERSLPSNSFHSISSNLNRNRFFAAETTGFWFPRNTRFCSSRQTGHRNYCLF